MAESSPDSLCIREGYWRGGMSIIRVLTYNVAHRKTYDTLCLLKARGYEDVK